ncbi:hypothetical protein BT63DRAFT_408706 [Microthyrium microscopicum]|uniref:Uncharacterized protein n=1 Tax=Microthyrium microscopicum TaxID=703497 RepID=A0A6A6UUB5_9PEZI|nr:hypothetical protein BT63DRAFT_408706 [Microthyrium microscopicum]
MSFCAKNSLRTHDIAVPIPCAGQNTAFRALVLTNSSLNQGHSLIDRVQHIVALSGGKNSIMMFLSQAHSEGPEVQSEHQCFYDLQLLLIKSNCLIPLLLAPDARSVPTMIKSYLASADTNVPLPEPAIPRAAIDILPYCTMSQPMDQNTFTALSDAFSNLADVSEMARSSYVAEKLMSRVADPTLSEACEEFWVDEFID